MKNENEICEFITSAVCTTMSINRQLIFSTTRKREVVDGRHTARFFIRKYTGLSLAGIGVKTGGGDHATVLHSIDVVRDLCDTDRHFNNLVHSLDAKISRFVNHEKAKSVSASIKTVNLSPLKKIKPLPVESVIKIMAGRI